MFVYGILSTQVINGGSSFTTPMDKSLRDISQRKDGRINKSLLTARATRKKGTKSQVLLADERTKGGGLV